jgi:hypothetical protein
MKYKPLTLTPVNFSLTEGTSIPAPLDSPPATPRAPAAGHGPLSSHPTPMSPVFPHRKTGDSDATDSVHPEQPEQSEQPEQPQKPEQLEQPEQPVPEQPIGSLSPTQRRPSSVRKFLGLRTLPSSDSLKDDRPSSPALTISSQKQTLTRKKSTSWFGRRKSSFIGSVPEGKENKESSTPAPRLNGAQISRPVSMMPSALPPQTPQAQPPPQTPQSPKPTGPPPPALPELKSFGLSDESLSFGGEDLFKNIK